MPVSWKWMAASTHRPAHKPLVAPADIPRRARFQARRTENIVESVIREMTRLSAQHNAVNLAQGFPDFPAPDIVKQAAADAIAADDNQYAITWGQKPLRDAIAAKYLRHYALELDPERELTVCCGATEGMIASLLAVTNPGDEIIIFEPHYENYGPDTLLCGAERRFVRLHPVPGSSDWRFDPEELRQAFSPRTKAIILNSPGNPLGQVFDRGQLETIAQLCQEFDALAITDEIYEHIIYDGAAHVPMMTIPGMRDRTIMVNSMSKTYAVTGWRVGWVAASPDLTESIRKVHDFLTVGAAAPLQAAGAIALALPDSYYVELARDYQSRRDTMLATLDRAGFSSYKPRGAYYVMADISAFGFEDDVQFARHLIENVGIAAVPGSSFFFHPSEGATLIRFCFCKKYETLKLADERLLRI
jgi:aspartate/methionine/tyrosine aminotransferase